MRSLIPLAALLPLACASTPEAEPEPDAAPVTPTAAAEPEPEPDAAPVTPTEAAEPEAEGPWPGAAVVEVIESKTLDRPDGSTVTTLTKTIYATPDEFDQVLAGLQEAHPDWTVERAGREGKALFPGEPCNLMLGPPQCQVVILSIVGPTEKNPAGRAIEGHPDARTRIEVYGL